jgi:hypothetical protein
MITLEKQFETNANQTGTQTFQQIKSGTRVYVSTKGRSAGTSRVQNVYIYQRITPAGKTYGFEVIIPNVIKAGTVQKFPNGAEQVYNDDTEFYPGANAFGRTGWSCVSEEQAIRVFDKVISGTINDQPESEENHDELPPNPPVKSKKNSIQTPDGEWSIKELADQLGLPYIDVSNWAQSQIREGKIRVVRTERRAARGRATNILTAV